MSRMRLVSGLGGEKKVGRHALRQALTTSARPILQVHIIKAPVEACRRIIQEQEAEGATRGL